MMTTIKHIKIFFGSLLITIGCACSGHLNDGHENVFSTDGCLLQSLPAVNVGKYPVQLFLETSGSMFGFMPGNNKTAFQTGLWDVITQLKDFSGAGLSLYQIRSKDEAIHSWGYDEFRTQLNSGRFQSSKSTDIPQMIDSIIARTGQHKLSILVSDLIFSPEDGSPALLDQITPDIRTRFFNKGYAIDIIQKTSEFHKKSGALVTGSPFYYWLIGPKMMVADAIKSLKPVLGAYHEISFGLDPAGINYSILPFTIPNSNAQPTACSENGRYYTFTNWDGSDQPIKIALAMDLTGISSELLTPGSLISNLQPESVDAKINVDKVEPVGILSNQTDQKTTRSIHASHVITLTVSGAHSDNIFFTLNIKRTRPNWIDEYNLDIDDNLRTKTCGLYKMIDGLNQAYKPADLVLQRPLTILITKNSN